MVHKNQADKMAHQRCTKLKENPPRGPVEIKISACINSKIIASERITPYRKDVISHCSEGEGRRKDKLLRNQAAHKKLLNRKIHIPPNVFINILKM